MMKLKNLPETLLRAFKEEQHAIEFITSGKFRLGELAYYRNIEDGARRDHSEGLGRYFDHQNIQHDIELGNLKYIFSCALPQVDLDYLRERFGRFVIRIDDPHLFVQHIEENLMSQGIRTFNGIHGRPVEYSKGTKIGLELDSFEHAELSVIQKPTEYHCEEEYRLFTLLVPDSGFTHKEFINIDFGQSLPYAKMIP